MTDHTAGAIRRLLVLILALGWILPACAQTPPAADEIVAYDALFRAVIERDADMLARELELGNSIERRDSHGRSALHVAAFVGNHSAMRKLVSAGADPNALEQDFYDIVTIAAVSDDLATMKLALELGCSAGNITSRYDGTALIAAAHLGHVEIVQTLITAGAPLDHVNNLGWTAVIEAIVLGDGGDRHSATLAALIEAGADIELADRRGYSPLQLARELQHLRMEKMLLAAGARER